MEETKTRRNYYLEGYNDKKIRITPHKRKIELTPSVNEKIKKTIENIIKREIKGEN